LDSEYLSQQQRFVASSVLALFLAFYAPTIAMAHHIALAAVPALAATHHWSSLYHQVDDTLQHSLEARLRQNRRWAVLLRKQKMAVGVVDLTHPEAPRFARLNGDTMMYAASLPKIAVLLAAFNAFESGTLPETPAMINDLQQMIRYSNNAATTRMIDRLGFETIASVLTAPSYRLFDVRHGGGLWVGKRYAKRGRRYPDPLHGLSHAATVTQVCRFYYLLATGRLISPQRSRQMLNILSAPGINHKFVAALAHRVPKTHLYRKSGTWKTWHADSVLVWGNRWRHYILTALVEDAQGEHILRELLPAVEDILH
jgi:beta-lactamase class A